MLRSRGAAQFFSEHRPNLLGDTRITHSSLCDVFTPQIIPDKVSNIFRCLRGSAHFFISFSETRGDAALGSERLPELGLGLG